MLKQWQVHVHVHAAGISWEYNYCIYWHFLWGQMCYSGEIFIWTVMENCFWSITKRLMASICDKNLILTLFNLLQSVDLAWNLNLQILNLCTSMKSKLQTKVMWPEPSTQVFEYFDWSSKKVKQIFIPFITANS